MVGEKNIINLAKMFLERLDKKQKQVALSVKVLDINLSDKDRFTQNWGMAFEQGSPFIIGKQGLIKSSIGEYKSSIEDFNKAIEINPNDDVSYCNRGSVKFRTKDKRGAIEDWEKSSILGNEMCKGYLKKYK